MAETEYMVRGRGYLRSADDIADLPLRAANGTPVRIRDIATVELGPDERRGMAELNGEGEVVAGIVVARFGENALEVIDGVKARIEELKPGLAGRRRDQGGVRPLGADPPRDRHADRDADPGVDHRRAGVHRCSCCTCAARSSSIIILPLGVLFSFICMKALGINSNIMSLGGIAIAIGEMVDAGVVMVENAHKHLERARDARPRHRRSSTPAARSGRRCSSRC